MTEDCFYRYTGVGSRQAPLDVLQQMTALAADLRARGWVLRSGHASGSDQAFELGAGEMAEVYLPWPSFESDVPIYASTSYDRPTSEAYNIAAHHHPAWSKLSRGARLLHARNVHQVLGLDCRAEDRSIFVVCWTVGAMGSGGTGQAIRIARAYKVPVVDMAALGWEGMIEDILRKAATR
jgi:hypothetical protein